MTKEAYAADKQALMDRIGRLYAAAEKTGEDWDALFVVGKINQYYFTGTMQEGLFVLLKDGGYAHFPRNSYERARLESPLDNLYPMTSYGDVTKRLGGQRRFERVWIESEIVTQAMLERMRKHFPLTTLLPADRMILKLRAVKSALELAAMEESGRLQRLLHETRVPGLLRAGMSEAELNVSLYRAMMDLGHQGVTRFAMFQTDMLIGQIGFGESALHPTSFDGPGGMRGASAYAPFIGSRERRLQQGDLVFVDIGFGIGGYHTDRTQVYSYGAQPAAAVVRIHNQCREIQLAIAQDLKPGVKPSAIYQSVIDGLSDDFLVNFMGHGGKSVKFVGHGVGLHIDEYPALAKGFDEPLEENMTLAIEPKKGLEGIGMVGTEDTYVVTPTGGRCLTGGEREIITLPFL